MAAVVYAFGARDKSARPWQNHELSELYRVVDLLGKAGLSVETDMGLSDEGEPWFVFCRADNGDVVVHFARIDGQYVAASSIVDQSYRGSDFRDIIDQLIRQQPLVVPRSTNGTSLFLHPAVVLTAFVATALFYSHQADASETSRDSVPVSLGDGHHAHVDLLLKLLTANMATAQHVDKVGVRSQFTAQSGTQLASLMAIAIATIVPLIDQTVELSLPPASVVSADHPVAVAISPLEGRGGEEAVRGAPHQSTASALTVDATDPVTFDHPSIISISTSAVSASAISASGQSSDVVPVARIAAHDTPTTGIPDHGPFHVLSHQALIQLADNGSGGTVTAAPQASGDSGHHISLSDLDPAAIQFFSLLRDNSAHSQTKTSTVGGGVSTVPSTPSATGADTAVTPGATPLTTNVLASSLSQSDWVALFNEFSFSGQHPLTGAVHATDYLASVLPNYLKSNGGTIQLIVYDGSHAVSSTIFPLTKDVIFVQDKELGGTIQSLHGTNMINLTLVNGDVMTLIGVITVDASHPIPLVG